MNRNPIFTPVAILPAAEPDSRSRQAWLASKRQELLAPAGALLELSEMMLVDASDCGHADFLRDQQQVHAAATTLLAMIHEVLDPSSPPIAEADLAKRVRHDLRTPLTQIIGLCEFWLEEGTDVLQGPLARFLDDLQAMVRHGKKLVEDINGLLDFGKAASDPDIDLERVATGGVDLIRDLVDSLPGIDANGPARPRETGVLLVVEDNPINRDLLVRRLVRDGHTVVEAADGRQGLALARSRRVDLILLDVIMPELNGLQMLQQLKADAELRHIPVIMISAFHELDGVVRCLEMGAEDYLAKPFNPVLLRARIDGCLEKKRLRCREARYRDAAGPRRFDNVAVLCCDVAGFVPFGNRGGAEEAVRRVQDLIERFEEIAPRHGVEKIRASGTAFLAAAGLRPGGDPVLPCLRCGLDMIAAGRKVPPGLDVRVGIDLGTVAAGVFGRQQPLFDLLGDPVSAATAMASQAVPGTLMLGASAWRRVAHCARGQGCGAIPLPGKGTVEQFRFDELLKE
jgi:CheY-like chemotaxis protein